MACYILRPQYIGQSKKCSGTLRNNAQQKLYGNLYFYNGLNFGLPCQGFESRMIQKYFSCRIKGIPVKSVILDNYVIND